MVDAQQIYNHKNGANGFVVARKVSDFSDPGSPGNTSNIVVASPSPTIPRRRGASSPSRPGGGALDGSGFFSAAHSQRRKKRQRVRLSCVECRRRKLSCDRGSPCERCVRSGAGDACAYDLNSDTIVESIVNLPARSARVESRQQRVNAMAAVGSHNQTMEDDRSLSPVFEGENGVVSSSTAGDSANFDHDRIRQLEQDVALLRRMLVRQNSHETSLPSRQPSPDRANQNAAASNANNTDTAARSPSPGDNDGRSDNNDGCPNDRRSLRSREIRTRSFGPSHPKTTLTELTGLAAAGAKNSQRCERAEDWLRPVYEYDRKDRRKRAKDREYAFAARDPALEALLPARERADALVELYLDQFEQLYRVVHIPSFKQRYELFWQAIPLGKGGAMEGGPSEGQNSTDAANSGKPDKPGSHPCDAAFTALILAMLSVTSCVQGDSSDPSLSPSPAPLPSQDTVSKSRRDALAWFDAVDGWLSRQGMKHRRLVHFQIACLLYLARRVNMIKKKRFWIEAGSLMREGVAVGLHRESGRPLADAASVFGQEMRRRIWATARELDVQASFEHGLPALSTQLQRADNALPPRNIDDSELDEDATELPPSRPVEEYTLASFHHVARHSLLLRAELTQMLCGPMGQMDYETVTRLTTDITKEIDLLPSWEMVGDVAPEAMRRRGDGGDGEGQAAAAANGKEESGGEDVETIAIAAGTKEGTVTGTDTPRTMLKHTKMPLLAYALLHLQLRQYLIPLHQQYIRQRPQFTKYRYSQQVCYNAARDIVELHDRLHSQGVRLLNCLRGDDCLTAAINLCSVTMLQPKGSTNMFMINAPHTLRLLERCLALKEDRILRSGNNEPWLHSLMCNTAGLFEAHLGTKSQEEAKAVAFGRFCALHKKLYGTSPPNGQGGLRRPHGVGWETEDVPAQAPDQTPVAAYALATLGQRRQTDQPTIPFGRDAQGRGGRGSTEAASTMSGMLDFPSLAVGAVGMEFGQGTSSADGAPVSVPVSMPVDVGVGMGMDVDAVSGPTSWLPVSFEPQSYHQDLSLELLGFNNDLWSQNVPLQDQGMNAENRAW